MPGSPEVLLTAGAVAGVPLDDGVTLYSGIPFAAPPVGPRRFRPPGPVAPWDGVRPVTPLVAPPQPTAPGQDLVMDEDCLLVNVWVPEGSGPRPVVVWFYGGGFETGSGGPPHTDAARLAARTGCVIVAPNYRLGALGWLDLAAIGGSEWAGSANLGLQDAVAALRWTREEIGAFGGDPATVTLAGESAGGFLIGALLAVPEARALFHRSILDSGAAERLFPTEVTARMARDLLAELGASTAEELLDVSPEALVAGQQRVTDRDIGTRNLPGGRSWGTAVDGRVLPEAPLEAVASGATAGIDLLVAATEEELKLFEVLHGDAYPPRDEEALLDEAARAGAVDPRALVDAYAARLGTRDLTAIRTALLTDRLYRMPSARLARAQRRAGGRAFVALFAGRPWGEAVGAGHATDLPYLFDSVRPGPSGLPAVVDPAIVTDVMDRYGRFAREGDPGWPLYDDAAPTTYRFGALGPVVEPPQDAVRVAWAWDGERGSTTPPGGPGAVSDRGGRSR